MTIKFSQFRGGVWRYQEFTSGGTWTRPTGVNVVEYLLVGAGGGGGGSYDGGGTDLFGGSGGGGGQVRTGRLFTTSNLTITIGAKGTGGAVHTSGTDGGDSTITGGSFTVTAKGGTRGYGATFSGPARGGMGGGSLLYADVDAEDGPEGLGSSGGANGGGGGHGNIAGGAGNGGTCAGFSIGGAGNSPGGGGGGSLAPGADGGHLDQAGQNGSGPGSGGGGGGIQNSEQTGGDGYDGYCLIAWVQ